MLIIVAVGLHDGREEEVLLEKSSNLFGENNGRKKGFFMERKKKANARPIIDKG